MPSYSSQLCPPSGLRNSRAGSVPASSAVTKRNVEAVSPAVTGSQLRPSSALRKRPSP